MRNVKQDPSRVEYWIHKLKSEVKTTPTQKNELAIKEFCEDIIQERQLHINNPRANFEKASSSALELLIKENKKLRKIILTSSVLIGAISGIILIAVLVNG